MWGGSRAAWRPAHLEVIQHLLPGQEQQSLLPHLPGDLRVEEGVLSAAVRHPCGGTEGSQRGNLAQDGEMAQLLLLLPRKAVVAPVSGAQR